MRSACNRKVLKHGIKRPSRDFPRGPVVCNPPSNAGDAGSIPGRGTEIPHAAGQRSPHDAPREAWVL